MKVCGWIAHKQGYPVAKNNNIKVACDAAECSLGILAV